MRKLSAGVINPKPERGRLSDKPLSEGLRRRRPKGFFTKMSDEELIGFAKETIRERGIMRRSDLAKAETMLYKLIREKRLLGRIGLDDTRGSRRPIGFFSEMSDKELIAYAKEAMGEKGISGREHLKEKESGIFCALKRRGLVDAVAPLRRRMMRRWASMKDDDIVRLATRIIAERGIRSHKALEKADSGLYSALKRRGLLDRLPLARKQVRWGQMRDEDVISKAEGVFERIGLRTRKALAEADGKLYRVVVMRRLFPRLGVEDARTHWSRMADAEIIGLAKSFMEKHGIHTSAGLSDSNSSLYHALSKRGLLGHITFRYLHRRKRDWRGMSDDEVVELAEKTREEAGCRTRSGFSKADQGLYNEVLRRGLMERIGLDEPRGFWRQMGDDELVRRAQGIVDLQGLSNRTALLKEDKKLYSVLYRRGLLDRIRFERRKRNLKDMDDDKLVAYALGIMEKEGITTRKELQKADGGVYTVLGQRGLLDRIGFKRVRARAMRWKDMANPELIAYGERVIRENSISTRKELKIFDNRLYEILRKRGLLGMVFSGKDEAGGIQALKQVVNALKEF